jgi:hypothetical protein
MEKIKFPDFFPTTLKKCRDKTNLLFYCLEKQNDCLAELEAYTKCNADLLLNK